MRPSNTTLPAVVRETGFLFPEATAEDFWKALDDQTGSDITVIGIATLSRVHIAPWLRDSVSSKRNGTMTFFEAISRGGGWPAITH